MRCIRLGSVFYTSLICLALLGAGSQAQANTRFTFAGLADMSNPKMEPDLSSIVTTTSGTSFGGGAWADFALGTHADFEIGALYVPRKFRLGFTSFPTIYSDQMSTSLQIPVLVRFNLAKVLSIGVGGYYGMGLGKLKSVDQDGATTEEEYSDAGYKKADYGLIGSIGLKFPLGSSVGLVIDGRYVMGLANLIDDSVKAGGFTSFKNVDMQGLVGLQFGMMK